MTLPDKLKKKAVERFSEFFDFKDPKGIGELKAKKFISTQLDLICSEVVGEERKRIKKAFLKHPSVDMGENSECSVCNRRFCICPERDIDKSWNITHLKSK